MDPGDFSTSVHESAHAVIAAHYGFIITAPIERAEGHMGVTERRLPDLEQVYVERARRHSREERRRVLGRAALMLATISLAGPTGERKPGTSIFLALPRLLRAHPKLYNANPLRP